MPDLPPPPPGGGLGGWAPEDCQFPDLEGSIAELLAFLDQLKELLK